MHASGILFVRQRSYFKVMEQYMTPFIIVKFTQNDNCVEISSTEQRAVYHFSG
jgi:hypothetical protein